jgi:hypothetical protein
MTGDPAQYIQKAWAWCRANKEFDAVMFRDVAILFAGFELSEIANSLHSIRMELSDIDFGISSIANRQ